jgi:hypothetical protein
MNEQISLSIVEMELAAMYAKLCSMQQTMVNSRSAEGLKMSEIAQQIDALRRTVGIKIEVLKNS